MADPGLTASVGGIAPPIAAVRRYGERGAAGRRFASRPERRRPSGHPGDEAHDPVTAANRRAASARRRCGALVPCDRARRRPAVQRSDRRAAHVALAAWRATAPVSPSGTAQLPPPPDAAAAAWLDGGLTAHEGVAGERGAGAACARTGDGRQSSPNGVQLCRSPRLRMLRSTWGTSSSRRCRVVQRSHACCFSARTDIREVTPPERRAIPSPRSPPHSRNSCADDDCARATRSGASKLPAGMRRHERRSGAQRRHGGPARGLRIINIAVQVMPLRPLPSPVGLRIAPALL